MFNTTQPLDLLERIGEGIFALDPEWRFAYLNRQAERVIARLSGTPSTDLLGSIIWDRPALADSSLGRALHRAYADQVPVIHEVPDVGTRGSVEIRAYPTEDGMTVLLRENPQASYIGQIVDHMDEAFLGCDHEWRVTHLNIQADAILGPLGLSRMKLLGQNVWHAIPGLAGSRLQAEAFRAHAQGSSVELEEFFPPLNRKFSLRIAPTSSGLVCFGHEIDSTQPAAEAVAGEERYRQLLESIDDVVFRLDQDQRCVDAFGRWLEREGIDPRQLIGRTTREIVGDADAHLHETANESALAGETVTYDWTFRSPGGLRHMQTTLSPLHGPYGEITGIVGVGRDISQRVEVGKELQRWARIFEHSGWGVAIVSADGGTIESVNPAFAAMHGWTVEELRGRPMSELSAKPQDFPRMNPLYDARGHQIWETERLHRDGTAFPALIDATAVKDEAGQVTYYAVNVQDLTERRRAEEQVRQAQKMEAVGRLAGGVAHDFNNMMMIIMGFSDFLLSTLEPNDPRWADADEIRKAAERAMHLTRQLLGFGRQQLVARQVLSLNDVVSGMERMLRPLLGEDIKLVTQLSTNLGGVEADHGQMEQVVMNLALNARDAMRGGGRLTIETLDLELPEGYAYRNIGIDIPPGLYVMLIVSDTGHGMTPEIKARLFEPFFTTKPTTQNSGLGLATVYGIVVQSGGYIWVESEPEKGTTFKICLPRVDWEDHHVDAPAQSQVPRRGSETILIVEDEEAVRSVAARVLGNQGYTVLQAANGQDALRLVEERDGQFDLVLTDVIMPDMGGLELTAQLRKRWPDLRLLYMSGYAEGDKLQAAIPDPERSLLQKPFSIDNLLVKVREVLDRQSQPNT